MSTREPGNSAQLVTIIGLLTDMYSAEEAAQWLRTPLHALGGRKPVDGLGDDECERQMIRVLQLKKEIGSLFATTAAR